MPETETTTQLKSRLQAATPTEGPKMNRLLRELIERTWLLEPRTLSKLQAIVERHAAGDKVEPGLVADIVRMRAESDEGELQEIEPSVIDRVAVVPVMGVIARFANQVNGISQPRGTSVETISRLLANAMDDGDVDAILLNVRSPGGSADGIAELGDEIAAANRVKPVFASVEGIAASAGYWIASQARTVYATRGSHVGSIGVYTVVDDVSSRYEAAGIRTHVVSTGPHKGVGIEGATITDEQLQGIRDDIGQTHAMFRAAVKSGRGSRLDDIDAVAGEKASGRVWLGKDAKRLGLIDKIGTFADALRAARADGRAAREESTSAMGSENGAVEGPRGDRMSEATSPAAEDITGLSAQKVLERCPAGARALQDAAREAERNRIFGILSAADPEQMPLVTDLVKTGATTEKALGALLSDMRKRTASGDSRSAALTDLEAVRGEQTATGAGTDEYLEPGASGAEGANSDAKTAWEKLSAADKKNGYGDDFAAFEALFALSPEMATEVLE